MYSYWQIPVSGGPSAVKRKPRKVPIMGPHSVVTHIGSVTHDQKVPGLNPVWVGCCSVDIYQWCLTGLTKAWLRAPKRPLGSRKE